MIALQARGGKIWSLRFDQLGPEARAIFREGDEIFFKHSRHPGRCLARLRREKASNPTAHKNDGNANTDECSGCETDSVVRMIVGVWTVCVLITFLAGILLCSWWFNGLDRPIRAFMAFYFFYHVLPAILPTVKRAWVRVTRITSEYERLDELDHPHFVDRLLDLVEVYMHDWAFSFNRVHKYNVKKCTSVGMDEGLLIVCLQPYPDLYTSPKLRWFNDKYLTYRDRQRVKLAAMEYARLESRLRLSMDDAYTAENGITPTQLQSRLISGRSEWTYFTDPSQYLEDMEMEESKAVSKAKDDTLERLVSIWDLFGNPVKYIGYDKDATQLEGESEEESDEESDDDDKGDEEGSDDGGNDHNDGNQCIDNDTIDNDSEDDTDDGDDAGLSDTYPWHSREKALLDYIDKCNWDYLFSHGRAYREDEDEGDKGDEGHSSSKEV